MKILFRIIFVLLSIFGCFASVFAETPVFWPEIGREAKPGAYWWWPRSAVDQAGLRWNIEKAAENGLGTLHIIPIYGVKGNEANDIEFMSEKWLEMLRYAIREANKHGISIDMTLGTGWCFGGPMVDPNDGNMLASFHKYEDGSINVRLRRNARAVKRAAPGGVGPMLDPFSTHAMDRYLEWFETKFKKYEGPLPRAFYHDSYEYPANWSPELYRKFEKLNGYKLQDHLDVFLYDGKDDGSESADRVRRIKADYRRTLAEMHLEYTKRWTDWARNKNLSSRNEAHGSPSNWLDVYAAADIPEIEFFRNDKNPLVAKFASSAAHVSGRKFVSSESGTWVDEHFNETLGGLKVLFDGFFLSGVNHLFYHGMIYSPKNSVVFSPNRCGSSFRSIS